MRVLLFALSIVACAPETVPDRPADPAVPPQAQPGRTDLSGEWQLAEMNGRTPTPDESGQTTPITMTVGDSTFRAQSQCIAFWRRYTLTDGRLVVTEANPGAMCARGLSPWETEFGRTLSSMSEATRTDRSLRLAGPAGSLLFDAATPKPKLDFTGRWRLTTFHGARPPAGETPIEITVTEDRITANACVFSSWRYRQDGQLLEITPGREAVCERTLSPAEQRFGAFMDRIDRATIIPDGGLILDSAAEQVEFRRVG
ncbi:MAG TPA: META domain-containing protein [Brevundimonas sp.]|nr:META domain-containing protein [Brevundimonas sp.]